MPPILALIPFVYFFYVVFLAVKILLFLIYKRDRRWTAELFGQLIGSFIGFFAGFPAMFIYANALGFLGLMIGLSEGLILILVIIGAYFIAYVAILYFARLGSVIALRKIWDNKPEQKDLLAD